MPLHGGFEAAPHLAEADAILVIESDVPWFPQMNRPRPETRVIHLGVDPLFSRYPMRGFPADLALAGTPRLALAALADAVARRVDRARGGGAPPALDGGAAPRRREAAAAKSRAVEGDAPIDMLWVSRCDRRVWWTTARSWSTSTISTRPSARFTRPRQLLRGAARRAGSAGVWAPRSGPSSPRPTTRVICCVGDGAYIFGSPTAAHFVSRAYNLPVLFVVFNNRTWNAVKRAVQTHAHDGWAARTDHDAADRRSSPRPTTR